ncbi:MAG: hypothetical protein JWR19_1642 [Pedosphaera sp.]|nr:hypothetical protein [Pedosphaera sp.]
MLSAKKTHALQLFIALALLAALTFLATALPASAQPTSGLLTNAADVLSLSADQASRGLKVSVKGIVTASDPTLKGRFFVQDSTGGVFVDNVYGHRPEPGDVVEISGISHAGAFAPIITAPSVTQIGTAPLPLAKLVPVERLMSGAEDSQRIETTGIVRAVREESSRLAVDVVSGGYRFRVYLPLLPRIDPQTLVAAQVRVRGTAAEAHNRSLRQLIAVEIYVPVAADFMVEHPEPVNSFDKPVIPLSSLAQYRPDNSFDQRVHVRGIVTLQRAGDNVFLQDATGGLHVQTRQLTTFSSGDVIEAVGFPSFENFRPMLQDAVFRKTSEPARTVVPAPVTIKELRDGLHHADLITINGKLLDRSIRRVRRSGSVATANRTVLILQHADLIFTAEWDEPSPNASLAAIPIGSTVEVIGICLTDTDDDGKFKSLQILLPASKNVRVVQKPDWLTLRRLLIGFGIVCSILIVFAGWTVMVAKRNSVLRYLMREKEAAQLELQEAHDQLEERVKERTAELKFQITARKESEVQSKAVLAERTRLAQEVHDTLEQSLTGIALQLDVAARLFDRSPEDALHHLELARGQMTQSQVQVRRSVWDLRCRALEKFDLAGALLASAKQFTYGTGIRVEIETKGQTRPLPEVIEENLLRVGQEALTNVIKHSNAKLAKIEFEFAAHQVALQIKDDGAGFSPENSVGPRDGHFGLLGMSERAKRVGGQMILVSAPGLGTTVRLEIPLSSTPEAPTLEPANGKLHL